MARDNFCTLVRQVAPNLEKPLQLAIDANCRGLSIQEFPASRARAVQGGLAFLRRLMRLTSDTNCSQRGCCDTLPEIFPRHGFAPRGRACFGLVRVGSPG